MKKIYKFSVSADQPSTWSMDKDARIVHVNTQTPGQFPSHGQFWAICDITKPKVRRTFRIFGTGHEIPDGWEYVGTFQDSPFVWHIFEWKD